MPFFTRTAAALVASGLAFGLAAAPAQAGIGQDDLIRLSAPVPAQSMHVPSKVALPSVAREGVAVAYHPVVVWPVGAEAHVSSGFGGRSAPTRGASSDHQGVDFTPGLGTPVHAAAAGTVREAVGFDDGGCGVSITLDHNLAGELVSTRYCHLAVGSLAVGVGQTVAAGQPIATVGNTGVSTGAHLHFEVRPGGVTAIDPLPWLRNHVF
ncbi:M23 family metallopeptidase [Leifsonia sp. NPDC058230]|uniref:M23 family metallopeptidase n=1 Tax=Leifsonia sp. NPDC058230 TaxID=3346391 RepID=UPI0036D774A3